jgi:hypothetical protein
MLMRKQTSGERPHLLPEPPAQVVKASLSGQDKAREIGVDGNDNVVKVIDELHLFLDVLG